MAEVGAATSAVLAIDRHGADERAVAGADPGECGPGLEQVLGHRAEVHQATGMVLAQLGIGAVEALARVRAHAFGEQRSLLDVAHDVVSRRMRFTEGTD